MTPADRMSSQVLLQAKLNGPAIAQQLAFSRSAINREISAAAPIRLRWWRTTNPALDHQHGVFNLGLVARVRWSARQQRAAVVGREFVLQGVGLWGVVVEVLGPLASLVGLDQAGTPPKNSRAWI